MHRVVTNTQTHWGNAELSRQNLTLSPTDDIILLCWPKGQRCPEAGRGHKNGLVPHMAARWNKHAHMHEHTVRRIHTYIYSYPQETECMDTLRHRCLHAPTDKLALFPCRGWLAECCLKSRDLIPDIFPKNLFDYVHCLSAWRAVT